MRVTTATKSFLSGIKNVLAQFIDHKIVNIRLISQLICDISRVPQWIIKNFNGTAILASLVLTLPGVFKSLL